MTPVRQFYDLHFIESYNDWRARPLDLRRAMNLALSANHLADWVFEYCKEHAPDGVAGWKKPKFFRTWLVDCRYRDFRLIWDVADAHKHLQLREPERVRSVTEVAGAFDLGAFDQMAFDTDRLVIVLEGGTGRGLPEVFSGVARMWEELLKEWEL